MKHKVNQLEYSFCEGTMFNNIIKFFILFYLSVNVTSFKLMSKTVKNNRFTKMSLDLTSSFNSIMEAYQNTMQNNGLLADMVTVLGTNSLSDFLAQSSERSKSIINGNPVSFDIERLKRFAIFGFFDGAVGHGWFIALDSVIKGTDTISIIEKISADTLVNSKLKFFHYIYIYIYIK